MESLVPAVLDLMSELFLLAATVAIGFIIAYVKSKTNEQQQQIIGDIIRDGVLFAQQMYGHLEGTERYNEAVKQITEVLNEKGLKITDAQLKLQVESTLKKLKAQFGEKW